MNRPDISFIIPVLHLKRPRSKKYFIARRSTIRELLRDITKNVTISHETIIVCNGQAPELADFIKHHETIDRYCLNSTNVGVSRSWNMGANMAEGRALCFVNDDVRIGKDSIEKLYHHLMNDEKTAIVGPKGAKWKNGKHSHFVGTENIENADAIAGFLFMIKTKVLTGIGGFDNNYTPAFYEEIDLGYSVKKKGYICQVIPGLNIVHLDHHGVSSNKSSVRYMDKSISTEDLHDKNKAYFTQKWGISND